MFDQIDQVEGVKWTISKNSLIGPSVPDSMIPSDIKSMLQSDDYEIAFICSEYESATDQVNEQIAQIDQIVKLYDTTGMVIGEAPLMKDLQDTTDADLVRVNVISIRAIFLIIMIPVAAMLGFTLCAMLQVAAHADRQEEKYFAEQAEKTLEEGQN